MINPDTINQLGQQILSLLPQGAQQAQQDIENNLKALLQNAFNKLDLVSREEFDNQTAVLQRTRQRLEALEEQLSQLESSIK